MGAPLAAPPVLPVLHPRRLRLRPVRLQSTKPVTWEPSSQKYGRGVLKRENEWSIHPTTRIEQVPQCSGLTYVGTTYVGAICGWLMLGLDARKPTGDPLTVKIFTVKEAMILKSETTNAGMHVSAWPSTIRRGEPLMPAELCNSRIQAVRSRVQQDAHGRDAHAA